MSRTCLSRLTCASRPSCHCYKQGGFIRHRVVAVADQPRCPDAFPEPHVASLPDQPSRGARRAVAQQPHWPHEPAHHDLVVARFPLVAGAPASSCYPEPYASHGNADAEWTSPWPRSPRSCSRTAHARSRPAYGTWTAYEAWPAHAAGSTYAAGPAHAAGSAHAAWASHERSAWISRPAWPSWSSRSS